MSVVEERMDAVDRGFEALERGELETFMAIVEENCSPECEFASVIGSAIDGTAFKGFDGIRAWFADLLDTVDAPRWKDLRYEAVGEKAFLLFARFEMTGTGSGIKLSAEVGQLYELESGLISRGASYDSHAKARAAAEALTRA